MALTLSIGPAFQVLPDYTPYILDFHRIIVEDSIQVASDTMEFQIAIYDGEVNAPQAGNEIVFQDGATKEFAGNITNVRRSYGGQKDLIIYDCSCRDYVWVLNRLMVNQIYTLAHINQQRGASETEIYAGHMIEAILVDLHQASQSDVYYNAFRQDFTNIVQGPEIQAQTFNRIPPSQAFDTIAQGVGFIWWLDFDKNVHFNNITTDVSPLTGNNLNIDTDTDTYYDLIDEEDIEGTKTRLILMDVINQSTTSVTLEFTGDMGDKHGSNDNKIFKLDPPPFSFPSVTTVTKDTGGGDVAQDKLAENVDGTITGGEGDSNDVFILVADAGSYVRFANANAVADSDVIKVTYLYQFVDQEVGLPVDSIEADMATRTGGDGVHEYVFAQTSGLRITDPNQLAEVRKNILARKGRILLRGQFKSWTKGWKAGQYFNRIWNDLSLNDEVYIIAVEKRVLTPADDPNLADNVIESVITYSNLPHGVQL